MIAVEEEFGGEGEMEEGFMKEMGADRNADADLLFVKNEAL
jgi:hypothetical protein